MRAIEQAFAKLRKDIANHKEGQPPVAVPEVRDRLMQIA
jgi:hypothetical protein